MAERAWLKQYHFKPGQSGNAGGRPKSAFKRVSNDAFIPFVEALMRPGGGLEDLYNSPERTDFDKTIVETWTTIGRTGNVAALREILDRIMGKPEAQPEQKKKNADAVILSELSDDELSRRSTLLDEAE